MRNQRTGAFLGAFCWALASVSAVMPVGCGAAATEDYAVVSSGQTVLSPSAAESPWQPPEAVVADLKACVKQHAGELKTYSHHTKFELKVAEEGDVERVDLRTSTLRHAALETCISDVLAKLSLPLSEIPLRSSEPVSGGERMRSEGQPLGVVIVVAGVALGPIIIVAAGVTLAVAIVAVATDEAIEAARRRTKREKWCYERIYRCVGNHLECSACFNECKKDGVWDERKCPLNWSN